MSILSTFKQQLNEDVLSDLKQIVANHQHKKIKFSDGQLDIDGVTAHMLLTVYNALNDDMKIKFENMASKSTTSFMKLVDFGWKQVK